ncbi:hypothetical protein [Streptomyces sp. MBT84]|uniref:hypothetical protein n=1 Tax=Streptomyces sp. MBT84 TaxID=1488414 RepID=UPI002076B26D|nr:hypothetical protein [Streptomyces sp. MBT84]
MLLTDTRLARAVGYGGLHKGEDYAFLIGVCARSAGELLPDVVYLAGLTAGSGRRARTTATRPSSMHGPMPG